MKRTTSTTLMTMLFVAAVAQSTLAQQSGAAFTQDWTSLSKHEAATEWFRDAKLGIYFHWGLYTVPAFDSEWYPRNMHLQEAARLQTPSGDLRTIRRNSVTTISCQCSRPSILIADDWAELFQQTGARFAGPVAEHHDGFSMWDSDVTPMEFDG